MPQPLNWIRKNLRNGANIGSVADGAFYLGRAGLLDRFSCTLHWQSQPAFAEAFPDVKLERDIYVIDRHLSEALSRGVAEWFVHDRIRASTDRERLQLRLRTVTLDRVPNVGLGFLHGGESNTAAEAALARFASWLTTQQPQ